MNAKALAALAAVWALIFLPGLGSTEIKGEEGRRILPAIAMLETGDWLVPQLTGQPYLRKPPLINWLIAGAFGATGSRTEWAARIPSALAVLALALGTATVTRRWLGGERAFVAGMCAMTSIAMIEKGRLAEIEAVYVALSGIGMVCWLSWDAQGRSRWLTWCGPAVFLGLAALAKGPAHLVYFYVIAGTVLFRTGRLRDLATVPHLAGLAVMGAIFAAWAVPYYFATRELNAAGVWSEQLRERVGGGDFDAGSWLLNIPRALSNYLPWLVFVPLWWKTLERTPRWLGLRDAVVWSFAVTMLIPGMLPRYTMPLFAPAALLTAAALTAAPERWLRTWQRSIGAWRVPPLRTGQLALATGVLIGGIVLLYAALAVPRINEHAETRRLGAQINAAVPPGAELLAFDLGYQPVLFYLRPPLRYVVDDDNLPDVVPHLLCRGEAMKKLREKWERVEVRGEYADPLRGGRTLCVAGLENRR